MKTPTYNSLAERTREEYVQFEPASKAFEAGACDRVLQFFETLRGTGRGDPVDCYDHSLQTATRALRDGADDEMVIAALLHDIGDNIASFNHAEVGAGLLRPYVSPNTYWMLAHHQIFQGYYIFHFKGRDRNEREKYRGHPAYQLTVDFCHKWDQAAFDADYDWMPIAAFEPAVRRIFAREPWGPHTKG